MRSSLALFRSLGKGLTAASANQSRQLAQQVGQRGAMETEGAKGRAIYTRCAPAVGTLDVHCMQQHMQGPP